MGEYFRGWRRKFGVIVLLMACALAALWVRSYSGRDSVYVARDQLLYYVTSERSGLSLPRTMLTSYPSQFEIHWSVSRLSDVDFSNERLRKWELLGFAVIEQLVEAKMQSPSWIVDKRVIPYWSIVLPLTALSAWLLLSRPNHQSPNTAAA